MGKISKSKRLKIVWKIDFDQDTGNWTAKIDRPISDKEVGNPSAKDFSVENVNLGVGLHVADVHYLEASTIRIINRKWFYEKDKQDLKETLRNMAESINAIHNPNAQLIS